MNFLPAFLALVDDEGVLEGILKVSSTSLMSYPELVKIDDTGMRNVGFELVVII